MVVEESLGGAFQVFRGTHVSKRRPRSGSWWMIQRRGSHKRLLLSPRDISSFISRVPGTFKILLKKSHLSKRPTARFGLLMDNPKTWFLPAPLSSLSCLVPPSARSEEAGVPSTPGFEDYDCPVGRTPADVILGSDQRIAKCAPMTIRT